MRVVVPPKETPDALNRVEPVEPELLTPIFVDTDAIGEVHVIGVYEGGRDPVLADYRQIKDHPRQNIQISVAVSTPVTLVLSAYEPIHWKIINTSQMPVVKKVIAMGYYEPTVDINGDVPIITRKGPYHYDIDNARKTADFLAQIQSLTKVRAATMQGQYSAKAFVVDGYKGKLAYRKQPIEGSDLRLREEIISPPKPVTAFPYHYSRGSFSCQMSEWSWNIGRSAASCSGDIIAYGSMKNSDSPEDAARFCVESGVKGKCCMYHLYGEGAWYVTNGAVQPGGRSCNTRINGSVEYCYAGGACR